MKKNKSTVPSRSQFRVLRQICNLIPAHPFRAPHPISDFRQVLAVQVDVSFVLDQLVPELLLQGDTPLAGLLDAIDVSITRWKRFKSLSTVVSKGVGSPPDLLWQTATDRTQELGSRSTLCRLENRAAVKEAWLIHQVLFEQFVESFRHHPKNSSWILIAPIIGCTACRWDEPATATAIITASCRSTSFAENSCWSVTLGPVTSI